MLNYYTEFWTNYFDFQGRARRSAYWYTWLMNIIVITILSVLKTSIPQLTILYGAYGLAALIPQLSISVRRLHDTGRSGLWLLLGALPAAGLIFLTFFGGYSVVAFVARHMILVTLIALAPTAVLIFFFCKDSDLDNYYGQSPKYHTEKSDTKGSFWK